MDDPRAAATAKTPADLQIDRAHPARVYDCLLGGKDNFAADREAAAQNLKVNPNAKIPPRENRAFLQRAVAYLTEDAGIRQFLDIGTGIPTSPNVHEVAQAIDPAAHIVYVDNDPIVLAHARALLTSTREGKTAYIDADLRDVDAVLGAPELRETLDLEKPVGLLLFGVMHLFSDSDDPHGITARFLDALPSGSYLALSHLTGDFDPEAWERVAAVAREHADTTMRVRSKQDIERFFDGLHLVDPGVQPVHRWRPESFPEVTDVQVSLYGGVARKP